jgi:hypothetical protein
MNTAFLLMAFYDGKPIIPVEDVCRDFFSHLQPDQFVRKIGAGEIKLPLVRAESSQKSAKGVHLQDLADYIDKRWDAARKELEQMTGRRTGLEAPEARLASATVKLGADAPEKERARFGYTDRNGNFRKIVAGLRAGQVRVTAADGSKWTEDATPTDPKIWHRKRALRLRTSPEK